MNGQRSANISPVPMNGAGNDERRRYVARHALDTERFINALVSWNGKSWIVKVNDEVLPDCCDTLEEAFTVAEAEITRRAPDHACAECRHWQPYSDGLG